MERFAGKVAVVTGASRGIGEAITKALAIKGVNVVGLARNADKLKTLSDEINENSNIYNGKFYGFQCDVSQEKEIKETFAKIKEKIGVFSILVNNAGILILPSDKNILRTEGDQFDTTFNINTKGSLLCAQEAINCMSVNSINGHIININSIAALPEFTRTTATLYKASKSAFRILASDLRREMIEKQLKIKITNVYPGAVITDMLTSTVGESVNKISALLPSEVAQVCISILNTPANVLISDMVLVPISQENF